MKQVLILGGTNFIGRVLVEKLVGNNEYELTLFNRGKRNADLFSDVNKIQGDRETDEYKKITSHYWDYIIDCSGYYPITFNKLLHALKDKVGRYVFISTISVFDLGKAIGQTIDENTHILSCTNEQKTSALPDAYGEKKAEMERILHMHDWLDKIILRPSLVYGKYDFTDRFYYWLWRSKFLDKIMLPNGGVDSVSITYVNDLADLAIAALNIGEHNTTYNAVTHDVTFSELVSTANKEFKTSPQLIHTPSENIVNAGIQPWQDIALWMGGNLSVSNKKVLTDFGITFSPFEDTVRDTAKYYESLNWPACKYGLSVEKEMQFLQ
jgi:2'-hydroxyisoflavone reductase